MCERYKFIGFTILGIFPVTTSSGERKKEARGLPHWKRSITEKNYRDFIIPHHTGFCFCTGKRSGLTVFDCDTPESYENIIHAFPKLKETLTVKTRKGAHIYCLYAPALETGINSLKSFEHVDIRNDMGIVFCPPTEYDFFGEVVGYEFIDQNAPLLPVPQELINDCKSLLHSSDVKHSKKILDPDSDETVSKNVTNINELTVSQICKINCALVPRTNTLFCLPVISNGVYEIGYTPLCDNSEQMYYIKLYEIMSVKISASSLDQVIKRIKLYEHDLTFDIYRASSSEFVLYCTWRLNILSMCFTL